MRIQTNSAYRLFGAVLFSAVLLMVSSCAETESPTYEQVQDAVANFFGEDKTSGEARRQLRTWGNLALPHLKKMAMEPGVKEVALEVVCSLGELETDEAIDFLIEIAAGKTNIGAERAVSQLFPMAHNRRDRKYLKNHSDFKNVIFKLASHESWLCRGQVAYIMGMMEWKDSLPILRGMLKDRNLSLREHAAEAIEKLTDEKVSIDRPEVSFPEVEIASDLVKLIGELPNCGWMTSATSFDHWFGSAHGILRWCDSAITLLGNDLEPQSRIQIDKMCHDFLTIPYKDTAYQLVSLVSDEREPNAAYAISFDREGNELWEYRPAKSGVESLTPLYDSDGKTRGVILGFGGAIGIVALDLEGKLRWDIPNYHVLYDVKTSASLPHDVVACGWRISLFNEMGKQVGKSSSSCKTGGDFLYAHNIEIFPNDKGEVSIVATGSGRDSTPLIVRYDKALTPIWKATLSHEAGDLAMLEPEGNDKLFVAATRGGELFVFNEDGMLKHHSKISEAQDEECPFGIYGVKAGLIGERTYAFSVGIRGAVLIYEVSL